MGLAERSQGVRVIPDGAERQHTHQNKRCERDLKVRIKEAGSVLDREAGGSVLRQRNLLDQGSERFGDLL